MALRFERLPPGAVQHLQGVPFAQRRDHVDDRRIVGTHELHAAADSLRSTHVRRVRRSRLVALATHIQKDERGRRGQQATDELRCLGEKLRLGAGRAEDGRERIGVRRVAVEDEVVGLCDEWYDGIDTVRNFNRRCAVPRPQAVAAGAAPAAAVCRLVTPRDCRASA